MSPCSAAEVQCSTAVIQILGPLGAKHCVHDTSAKYSVEEKSLTTRAVPSRSRQSQALIAALETKPIHWIDARRDGKSVFSQ
jgi:hypothetical protein